MLGLFGLVGCGGGGVPGKPGTGDRNQVPVAVSEQFVLEANSTLGVDAPGLLANDTDPDSDPLTALPVAFATHGRLRLFEDGSFTYTPDLGFVGDDSFSYRALDGKGFSNIVTVSLSVRVSSGALVSHHDYYRTEQGQRLVLPSPGVLTNDVDPDGGILSAQVRSPTLFGELMLAENGSFSYEPQAANYGVDHFRYRASNGQVHSEASAFVNVVGPPGGLAFARRGGGTVGSETVAGLSVAALANDNFVVVGEFTGSPVFGPGEPGEKSIDARGQEDIFVARFYPDGRLAWAQQAGGPARDRAQGVAALADGSLTVVVGVFQGTARFGDQALSSLNGSWDAFLAAYDALGTLLWVKRAGGPLDDEALAVAVSPSGIAVTGRFRGTAVFAPGEAREATLPPDGSAISTAGDSNIFFARYALDGAFEWARAAGGPGDRDLGLAVDLLPDGSLAATGFFERTAQFASTALEAEAHTQTSTATDVFVARYGAMGALQWVKRAGGQGDDFGSAITAVGADGIAVSGVFTTRAGFGEPGAQTRLRSVGDTNPFVARYAASDGALSWAQRIGGDDRPWLGDTEGSVFFSGGLTALADGSVVLTGRYRSADQDTRMLVSRRDAQGELVWERGAIGGSSDPAAFSVGWSAAVLSDQSVLVAGEFSDVRTFGQGEPTETVLTAGGAVDLFVARYYP